MDNYILLYWQGIQDGTYTVGKWVWLFYKYIVEQSKGNLVSGG